MPVTKHFYAGEISKRGIWLMAGRCNAQCKNPSFPSWKLKHEFNWPYLADVLRISVNNCTFAKSWNYFAKWNSMNYQESSFFVHSAT